MTEQDLSCIEASLGIALPNDYRQLVLDFPIKAYEGNADSILWDDADALIRMNKKYRDGFAGMKPWSQNQFFIGDDGAASTYSIDVSVSPSPVYVFDHGNPERVEEESQSVASWIKDFIESNDIYPSAEPEEESLFMMGMAIALVAAVGTAIGIACWYLFA